MRTMNVKLKKSLQSTAITAVLFFCIMGSWMYFSGDVMEWEKLVIQSIIFAVVMTVWFSWSTNKALKATGITNPKEADLNVYQTTTLETSLDIDEVTEMLKTNPQTKGWTLQKEGEELTARSEMTWRSWGERVTFKFEEGQLTITSRPAWRTTVYDGGKNLENIYMLTEMISNSSKS